jgi:hypothetical protein
MIFVSLFSPSLMHVLLQVEGQKGDEVCGEIVFMLVVLSARRSASDYASFLF